MSYSLYDIDGEMRLLLEQAQEFDGDTPIETTDEWLATFEEMKGDRGKKLESIVHVRNQALYHATGIGMEIDRLNKLMKREDNLADKMVGLLTMSMKNANETEVKTELFKAKFVKNPPKLILSEAFDFVLDGGQTVYSDLVTTVESNEAIIKDSKAKMSEARKDAKNLLKQGETIDGAHLEQSERLKIE